MQEYSNFNESGKNSANITPLIFGAVVGAGIALLLAPAHGKDTRRRVGYTVKRLGDGARQAFQRTRDSLNDVKRDAKAAIDKGRQEYMRSRGTEGMRASHSPAL